MGIGSSFAAGYNSTRKQQRSLMPAVNTLSDIIARRKRSGDSRGARLVGPVNNAEDRADAFFAEKKAEEDEAYLKSQIGEQQRREDEKAARDQTLLAAEEARRQETHELEMQKQQQAMGQQEEAFNRNSAVADRAEAYEMVKQGLMMRDAKTVNAALAQLVPSSGEDVVTEGEPVDGARSFKGRPAAVEVPQFIFDPDSDYVGVVFPGQKKPTLFKNAQQAFQNVVAPINPAHEKTKDQITAAKNTKEAQYKEKKLTADIHKDAHEAAMQQFESDGYYQPALYNKEKYETAYADYVSRATGRDPGEVQPPMDPTEKQKKAKAPAQIYRGDEPPKGYPGAKRGKDDGWYIKKGKGWAPILRGKSQTKKKTGKLQPMQSAGINAPAGGKNIVRKKVPARGADYFEH